MITKNYNSEVSICNRDFLMCDNDIMSKERIEEECNCVKKATCFEIVRLLKNKEWKDATELLEKM